MDIPEVYCSRFHESANRPHLLLGCEPKALAVAFFLCLITGYSLLTWWGILGSIVLFLLLRQGLQELAKQDPIFLNVYDEARRYKKGFWTAKPIRAVRWRSR